MTTIEEAAFDIPLTARTRDSLVKKSNLISNLFHSLQTGIEEQCVLRAEHERAGKAESEIRRKITEATVVMERMISWISGVYTIQRENVNSDEMMTARKLVTSVYFSISLLEYEYLEATEDGNMLEGDMPFIAYKFKDVSNVLDEITVLMKSAYPVEHIA